MLESIRRLLDAQARRRRVRRLSHDSLRHRLAGLEKLEERSMMAADIDDLSAMNDEFEDAATLATWQRLYQVEGWNADQLHIWDIDQTNPGQMTMQPETSVWYQDWRGPMAFRTVTGDFIFTTEVTIGDRDDVGVPDADDIPNEAQFSLAGLMIRAPRDIVDPAVDWQPGSQVDDGTTNGENYVFLSMGHGVDGQMTLEVKDTRNSHSELELTPIDSNTAQLRIARIGDAVITLYRLPGEDWTVHRRFTRTNLPETLQLGLVSYTDWLKASDFDPYTHNGTTLVPGVDDPTPYEPFNPDLDASFEFVHYARPDVPAELAGVDLTTASDQQLLAFLGDGTTPEPEPEPEPDLTPQSMDVGVNLEGNLDWSPAWIFKDAFLRSRPWSAQYYNPDTGESGWQFNLGEGPALQFDENGWIAELPTWVASDGTAYQQRATTVLFTAEAQQPAGVYRVEWDGTGELSMWYVTETGTTPEGRHYALLDIPANAQLSLQINSTDPADPIRNISVWMPDYEGQSLVGDEWSLGDPDSPFHPLFVERLQDFDTIRFMDWMATNFGDVVTWDDRRTLDDATQSDGDLVEYYHTNGIALEYMIELANELDADPWFNMPHQADDEFVYNFATMVRDHLDPNLTIYVEWSNELWNSLFPVNGWLNQQMLAPENAGMDFFEVAGQEMQRDFDIWTEVFAGQEDRFVRIVAGQQANPYILDQLLTNVDGRVDAVSVSAYAGISLERSATFTETSTADDIIDALYEESIPWAIERLAAHRELADQYEALLGRELRLLTYESGSHVIANPSYFPYNDAREAAIEAMRSPRMYDVYQTLLAGARDAGVDLYNEFIFTGGSEPSFFGNYGLLFGMEEPLADTHQLRSILDFIHAQDEAPEPDPEPEPDPDPEPPVNEAPVFTPIAAQTVVEGDVLVFEVSATDADAEQTLTYSLGDGAPAGMTIDPLTGVVTWQPADALTETDLYVVTILATDNGSPQLVAETTVEITVANAAPTADIDGAAKAFVGKSRKFILLASDPSAADSESFTFDIDWNGDGTIDETVQGPSGTIVTHAFATPGAFNVTVSATDKDGATSLAAEHSVQVVGAAVIVDPANPTKKVLNVFGSDGNDVIVITPTRRMRRDYVQVQINGQFAGEFHVAGPALLGTPKADRVQVFGGDGADILMIRGKPNTTVELDGGAGDDLLIGGEGGDVLIGGAGRDLLLGGAGDDHLDGGSENDWLVGGSGRDTIIGGPGGNVVIGGSGPLRNLPAEWNSKLRSANRIANLSGFAARPRRNGASFLNDAAVDSLFSDHRHHGLFDGFEQSFADLLASASVGKIANWLR